MTTRATSGGNRARGEPRHPVLTYVVTNLALPAFVLLFFVFNRTTIYGRHRVPRQRNTLLLSNHQTMIDSFLVGLSAFYPRQFLRPFLIPWNPAAEENFFKNRLFTWFFTALKCIPVRPGRRDIKAIYRSLTALREGTMILFPEGTRSRDGSVRRGRPGAGMLVLGTSPTVIPVTIRGADGVLPIGRKWPRFGQRVHVYFGKPLDYTDFSDAPRSKETAQEVVDRVMERIRFQARVLERLEGGADR